MSYRVQTIRRGAAGYPSRLATLSEAPEELHVRGHLMDMNRVVAIVGARAAGMAEARVAHGMAEALARAGIMVISGGAVGVDAAAHEGTVAGGGGGVAVLGCGIDVPYPEQNQFLFDRLCATGGAVVSQFAADAAPRAWHFIKRNTTIAGMADAVVVLAASIRSGALHTARAAHRLGRLVAAMPGSPGCDALIATGAAVVRCAEDLELCLAGRPLRPQAELPAADSPFGRVLASLDSRRARSADDIAERTGMTVREVTRALTGLELEGLAFLVPGHNYVRSTLAQELLVR